MTDLDLVKRAMRLLSVIGIGETPTDDEYVDGRAALNSMIDGWNAERLALPAIVRVVFGLSNGDASYTIGVGGNINTPRPGRGQIERVGLIVDGSERSLGPLLTTAEYARIPDKAEAGIPSRAFYDGGFPLGTISLNRVPDRNDLELVLYVAGQLSAFTANTEYTFPAGYQEAFEYNLAKAIAPSFDRMPSELVLDGAREFKSRIKNANAPEYLLEVDPALRTRTRCMTRSAFLNGDL